MERADFRTLLESNRDWIVVYLSAPWCIPCGKAGPIIEARAAKLPEKVTYLHLNVDTCFDVYALLRAKKQVKGIPALLGYKPGNVTFLADVSCSGSDERDIDAFFSKIC
jgi:thioredoxin-like negative regulator of GroEL